MTFSYDRAWADVVAMMRANWAILLTLTGIFIFLPLFAQGLLLPAPVLPTVENPGSREETLKLFYALYEYILHYLWVFLMVNIITAFGQIVIFVLLIDSRRPTVAEALYSGMRLFPGYFSAGLLANFAVAFGIIWLFVVPGLYLLGRFMVLGPVIADLRCANPIVGLRESVRRTRGYGWRIVGLVLLVFCVGWVAATAAASVITIIGSLLLPDSVDPMAGALGGAIGSAAFGLLIILLSAGIYRQLAPSNGT
jgi:hypothetical protein